MAASSLLGAAAACEILLPLPAGRRQSYWSGCIVATVIFQQIFSILALVIFVLKFLLIRKCFKIVFCLLSRRGPVLECLCKLCSTK